MNFSRNSSSHSNQEKKWHQSVPWLWFLVSSSPDNIGKWFTEKNPYFFCKFSPVFTYPFWGYSCSSPTAQPSGHQLVAWNMGEQILAIFHGNILDIFSFFLYSTKDFMGFHVEQIGVPCKLAMHRQSISIHSPVFRWKCSNSIQSALE